MLAYVGRSRAYDSTQAGYSRTGTRPSKPFRAALHRAALCFVPEITSTKRARGQHRCEAIVLDPKLVDAWTYRGDIYLALKQYDLAIADYNHAIELNSTWMWRWVNRGEAYLRENQIDRAIQDFEQVIKLNPDYAMGFLDRGIARMNQNNIDAALADFQTGLKVDPQCGSCYVGQGLVKQLKGDGTGGSADITRGKALSQHAVEDFAADGIAFDERGRASYLVLPTRRFTVRPEQLHSLLMPRQDPLTAQLDLTFEEPRQLAPHLAGARAGGERCASWSSGSTAIVWVEGEISNFRPAPSGHVYFTLKDADAQLPVVLFRRQAYAAAL